MDDNRTSPSQASTASQVVENLLDGEPLDPKETISGLEQRNPKYAFIDFSDLDTFTQNYLEAAFWTEEERLKEEAVENGIERPDMHDYDWSPEALQIADEECRKFQGQAQELLQQAGGDEQNGHDFWLTRNGHGAGFWDRGYHDEIGDGLSEISKQFGEKFVYLGDDGLLYFG